MPFSHPWLLALLGSLPLAYLLAVHRPRGRRTSRGPRGPWPAALALRLLVLAALVLAVLRQLHPLRQPRRRE